MRDATYRKEGIPSGHLDDSYVYGAYGGGKVLVPARRALASSVSPTLPTAGITGGTGTICKTGILRVGDVIETRILIDLTGLHSEATDGDIIGVDDSTDAAYITQILEDYNGTILFGHMECYEVPAGGDPNIDLYAADEGTGVEDGAIGSLTETRLLDAGGDWATDDKQSLTALPTAGQYLYLTQGDATGTDADYTAGKFMITLYGYH